MKKSIILFLFVLCSNLAAEEFDHTHQAFTKVLDTHLKDLGPTSSINYKALKAQSKQLNEYLIKLSSVKRAQYKNWKKDQQLAFLINAYNAFTIKLILDHYPVESIKDIGGLFSSPWKLRFFSLLEEKMHLDQIEHEIIRKKFKEPRIHFAVVCASIGCPKLQAKAYTATNLEKNLEEATKTFLKDSNRNRYLPDKNEFEISKIFKWYDEDFGSELDLKKFLNRHMELTTPVKKLRTSSIDYTDYDWSLNEHKGK